MGARVVLKRNELVILLLGGLLLGSIEAAKMIPYPGLETAVTITLVYIAVGLGIYRKPN